MFYLFLLLVAAVGGAIYLMFLFNAVPGFKEERLGVLEPLPERLGEWLEDRDSDAGRSAAGRGEKREVRHLVSEGGVMSGERLIRQVRYRSIETNQILRVEPDQPVKRRRLPKHS